MAFTDRTRRKLIPLGSKAKGSANPLVWDIPRTGLLARIYLYITATVAGTISAPHALGAAVIVRRVRLRANSGHNLIDISGPDYHYLWREFIGSYNDPVPQSTARNAVAAATFNLDMVLPLTINERDPLGLFMLQNEQTLLQLEVEFEDDANIATGVTGVTATVVPYLELFTVPLDPQDWPPLNAIIQTVSESRTVSGAGDVEYMWPRGNTYLQMIHGLGIGQSPADSWTRALLRVNQSETLWDVTPVGATIEHNASHGRARLLGVIPIDLMGSSGLGNFASIRDAIYSAAVTDIETVISATGAATLYTLRRQIVALAG